MWGSSFTMDSQIPGPEDLTSCSSPLIFLYL